MVQQKQAFTLIELLVVVLIIGILAAVALPQYQVAVLKSKYSKLIIAVTAIANAEELYYLSNGSYVDDTRQLDWGEFDGCVREIGYVDCPEFIIDPIDGSNGEYNPLGFLRKGGVHYLHGLYHGTKSGIRECWAPKDNNIANKVCKSYNASLAGEALKNTYNRYTMP